MADLTAVAATNFDKALASETDKSADVVAHDGVLRQIVIAPREGIRPGAHNSPPAVSLQAPAGKVRVEVGESQQGMSSAGEMWVLTHERHSVLVLEDAVFPLATVASTGEGSHSWKPEFRSRFDNRSSTVGRRKTGDVAVRVFDTAVPASRESSQPQMLRA